MKIKKIILWGGVLVVLLGVIGVVLTAIFLDAIVKKGVETVGPKLVQVPITMSSIHIGVLTGSAKVHEFVVGNPDGYKSPFAISVGVAEVGLDVGSVLNDKIVVHTIHVESPEISFEGGLTKNNLTQIMDNLNALTKGGEAAETNAQAQAGVKPSKKIEVDDFLITGAKVHVILTALGGKEMTLPIPEIHLTDLGKGDAGLTPADLTKRIFEAITTTTLKTVVTSATDLGKNVQDLGKGAGKAAAGAVDKVTSGIGGLFKKP